MHIRMEANRPEINRHRFYTLRIEPDLLGGWSLAVSWGRIGRPGRQRVYSGGDLLPMVCVLGRLIAARHRHGYRIVRRGPAFHSFIGAEIARLSR